METLARGRLLPLLAIAVVAAFAFGALAEYTYFSGITATVTLTSIQSSYPLQSSVSGSGWNFTVRISSNYVEKGFQIQLTANLTNTSPSNRTISAFSGPFPSITVWSSNGTEVWEWPPTGITSDVAVEGGHTISEEVWIPTSQLSSGQAYLISAVPLAPQFQSPVNFTLNFLFVVYSART
jgi:hypothetical protein